MSRLPSTAGDAAPENPRLFARDSLERRAEKLLMIEADAHHHGDRRIDDVDRIQPAAHADLEHPGIEPRSLEYQQRRERVVLEESQRDMSPRRRRGHTPPDTRRPTPPAPVQAFSIRSKAHTRVSALTQDSCTRIRSR